MHFWQLCLIGYLAEAIMILCFGAILLIIAWGLADMDYRNQHDGRG